MAVTFEILRNDGHPWDQRPGFDLMAVNGETEREVDEFIHRAKRKFWATWINGFNQATNKPCAILYKPCGVKAPWEDLPNNPHPGGEVTTDAMNPAG